MSRSNVRLGKAHVQCKEATSRDPALGSIKISTSVWQAGKRAGGQSSHPPERAVGRLTSLVSYRPCLTPSSKSQVRSSQQPNSATSEVSHWTFHPSHRPAIFFSPRPCCRSSVSAPFPLHLSCLLFSPRLCVCAFYAFTCPLAPRSPVAPPWPSPGT